MPWEKDDIPEYFRLHREVADKAIMSEFGITDLSPYEIEVSAVKGGHCVHYVLFLGGYRSNESYYVNLTPEKEVESIIGEYGQYAKYLGNATEEAFAVAKEKLAAQIEGLQSDKSGYYLSIDSEGYLCLSVEIIVDLDEPDENGMDHKHLFFQERICR